MKTIKDLKQESIVLKPRCHLIHRNDDGSAMIVLLDFIEGSTNKVGDLTAYVQRKSTSVDIETACYIDEIKDMVRNNLHKLEHPADKALIEEMFDL